MESDSNDNAGMELGENTVGSNGEESNEEASNEANSENEVDGNESNFRCNEERSSSK